MEKMKRETGIVRKGELTLDELKIYRQLTESPAYWLKMGKMSIQERKEIVKPVLSFMYNLYFNSYCNQIRIDYSNTYRKKEAGNDYTDPVGSLRDTIMWYFKNGYVSKDLQLSIAKKENVCYGGGGKSQNDLFDYIEPNRLPTREVKLFIKACPTKLMTHALKIGSKRLVMLAIKESPPLFDRLRTSNYSNFSKQMSANLKEPMFVKKAKRMALLQPSSKKVWLHAQVTRDILTPTFCKQFAQLAGINIARIPSDMRTAEICEIAVAQAGSMLEHVPREHKTDKLCALALKKSATSLKFIPAELQSSKLILRALLKNKKARRYIKKGAVGHSAK